MTGEANLPLTLEDTVVTVNGVPSPLVMSSDEQVNFIAPFAIDGNEIARVRIIHAGQPSQE